MIKYRFVYNKYSKSFECFGKKNNQDYYVKVNMIRALRNIDNTYFTNLVIKNNLIILRNDRTKYIFEDYDKMCLLGLTDYFPDMADVIKFKIKEKQIIDKVLPVIKGTLKNRKKIVAASIVLGLLATTSLSTSALDKANVKVEDEYNDDNILTDSEIESLINQELDRQEGIVNENEDFNNSETNNNVDNTEVINLNYETTNDVTNINYVKNNYGEIINKYSSKWGIDSRIVTAIISQESGGRNDNLMQIEFNAWDGTLLSGYNYIDNKYEKYLLTNDKDKHSNDEYTVITSDDLKNPITNISICTLIYKNCLKNCNNNIVSALLMYNQGITNINSIYTEARINTGETMDEYQNNPNDLSYLDYTYASGEGDPNYVYNVLRYIENPDEALVYKTIDNDGNINNKSCLITYHEPTNINKI